MVKILKANVNTHAHKSFTVKRLNVQSFYHKISHNYTLSIMKTICNHAPHTIHTYRPAANRSFW